MTCLFLGLGNVISTFSFRLHDKKMRGKRFFFPILLSVSATQEAADSLVEDFVITESAEAVGVAIAESTVQQVRGGA